MLSKTFNEVKNEWVSNYSQVEEDQVCFHNGWEAYEAELIKRAEGRQFWIREAEAPMTKEVYWQVHREGVWTENKNAVSKFNHVIEMTAYNALQVKLDKAIDLIKRLRDSTVELYPVDLEEQCSKTLKEIGAE